MSKPRLTRAKKVTEPDIQLVPLGWAKAPATKNQQRRDHYRTQASIKKVAMAEAQAAIRTAGTKPVDRALVRLCYRPGTKRLCDADGLFPTLAIAMDALVHEGILEDDNLLHVFEASVRIWPPMRGLPAAFWLEIEPVAEVEAA